MASLSLVFAQQLRNVLPKKENENFIAPIEQVGGRMRVENTGSVLCFSRYKHLEKDSIGQKNVVCRNANVKHIKTVPPLGEHTLVDNHTSPVPIQCSHFDILLSAFGDQQYVLEARGMV